MECELFDAAWNEYDCGRNRKGEKELGIWGNTSIYIIIGRNCSPLMSIVEGNQPAAKVSVKEDL